MTTDRRQLTTRWIIRAVSVAVLLGCGISLGWFGRPLVPEPTTVPVRPLAWHRIDELPLPLAQFNTVFWEPRDTESLRQRILRENWSGKRVLEIGTGSGLIALCFLHAGASQVVATDINPAAVANARYNATQLGVDSRLDVRLVPAAQPSAFSVIRDEEQFDLIVSNPPWEDAKPQSIAEHALYDPGFKLLQSIIEQSHAHLKPGGRVWLVYGAVAAIEELQLASPRFGWQLRQFDDRRVADLPPIFLPGMLLELQRQKR